MAQTPELNNEPKGKGAAPRRPVTIPRRRRLILAGVVAAAAGTTAAFGSSAVLKQIDGLLPDARGISAFSRPGTVTILSADGEVLQKLGPASREKLSVGQMPELVKEALNRKEDG